MAEMSTFKVWDENGSEETANNFEAEYADAAAEQFADDDVDGQADDIYEGGHEVCVRDPSGLLHRFEVTVEYHPIFYVMPIGDPVAPTPSAAHAPVDGPAREDS